MEREVFFEAVATNLDFGGRQLAAVFLSQGRYDRRREGGSKLPHCKTKSVRATATSSAKRFEGPQTGLNREGSQEKPGKGQTTLVSAY